MQNTLEWIQTKNLVPYEEALTFMSERVAGIIEGDKSEAIWLLEHPPIYTAGTSSESQDLLNATKFPVYQTGRGGQYTYHGPGQRIAYILLNLKKRNMQDVRLFVTKLEQLIINIIAHYGLSGKTYKDRVGVWVLDKNGNEKKIAAIGIRIKKWVTYHGIAINVFPNLADFSGIVPCGIKEFGVTSFADLGIDISLAELDKLFKQEFEKIF